MKCMFCGGDNEKGVDICVFCGNKLQKTIIEDEMPYIQGMCGNCGYQNSVNTRICKNCGEMINEIFKKELGNIDGTEKNKKRVFDSEDYKENSEQTIKKHSEIIASVHKTKKGKNLLYILLVIAVVIILLLIFTVIDNKYDKERLEESINEEYTNSNRNNSEEQIRQYFDNSDGTFSDASYIYYVKDRRLYTDDKNGWMNWYIKIDNNDNLKIYHIVLDEKNPICDIYSISVKIEVDDEGVFLIVPDGLPFASNSMAHLYIDMSTGNIIIWDEELGVLPNQFGWIEPGTIDNKIVEYENNYGFVNYY